MGAFLDAIVFLVDTYYYSLAKLCTVMGVIRICFTALPNITMQPASKAIREGELNVIATSYEVVGISPVYFKWEKYHTVNNSWIKPSDRAVNTTSPNLKFSQYYQRRR